MAATGRMEGHGQHQGSYDGPPSCGHVVKHAALGVVQHAGEEDLRVLQSPASIGIADAQEELPHPSNDPSGPGQEHDHGM